MRPAHMCRSPCSLARLSDGRPLRATPGPCSARSRSPPRSPPGCPAAATAAGAGSSRAMRKRPGPVSAAAGSRAPPLRLIHSARGWRQRRQPRPGGAAMGVRSSSGSSSSSRRAQPAPGKRAPERSSGGAACPPGAAAAASAGARPGRSAASARRPWPWPLPSASQALRAPSLPAECLARPLPLEGPHRAPPLRCPGAAPASPRLGPRGTLRRVPPAPPNPSFYAGPGRAATRPPCLLWTSLRAPPAQPVAQRCWDPGEKAPGNERPQRRTAAQAPRVGWVCTGARGRSAGRCARPLPCEIAHCSAGCAWPTPSKAPLSPAPEPCVRRARSRPGLGVSRGVLREAARCWAPSGLPARGKCRFSPRLSGEPRVSRKGWLRCPPACSSPCPGGARSWGLRSPGCTSLGGVT